MEKKLEPWTEPGRSLWEGRWAGKYLAFLIADPPVELLPLQAEKVLPRLDDAALGCNGPGSVNVVPGHHADCNASTLAFSDSFRDLEESIQMDEAIVTRCSLFSDQICSTPTSPVVLDEAGRMACLLCHPSA